MKGVRGNTEKDTTITQTQGSQDRPNSAAGKENTQNRENIKENGTLAVESRLLKYANRLDAYDVGQTLGQGEFAKVKSAVHKATGCAVAIKITNKENASQKSLRNMYREVELLRKLWHPHVVRLYEVIDSPKNLCLVMEGKFNLTPVSSINCIFNTSHAF